MESQQVSETLVDCLPVVRVATEYAEPESNLVVVPDTPLANLKASTFSPFCTPLKLFTQGPACDSLLNSQNTESFQ